MNSSGLQDTDRKLHWERIYQTKALHEFSWYQAHPQTSLSFFSQNQVLQDAAIIDIGGGDSLLCDHLLSLGYRNITVLDISAAAIARAKERLGKKARLVQWVVSDVLEFVPDQTYDVWHDRAAFHFLTQENEINNYRQRAYHVLSAEGRMLIATFSEAGPEKCSGILIRQYTEDSLHQCFAPSFETMECYRNDHTTPSGTQQNFVFCSFKKIPEKQ